ncbi:MAG: hypothetical protein AB8H86_29175 [Polyangiales bacterium]
MRYELGVLQLLVASGGKRNPARVEVVERALGVAAGSLDDAMRFLQGRGLVNPEGQPTDAGIARARGLSRHVRAAQTAAQLPSRLPPPSTSGVFQKDEREREVMNDYDDERRSA